MTCQEEKTQSLFLPSANMLSTHKKTNRPAADRAMRSGKHNDAQVHTTKQQNRQVPLPPGSSGNIQKTPQAMHATFFLFETSPEAEAETDLYPASAAGQDLRQHRPSTDLHYPLRKAPAHLERRPLRGHHKASPRQPRSPKQPTARSANGLPTRRQEHLGPRPDLLPWTRPLAQRLELNVESPHETS